MKAEITSSFGKTIIARSLRLDFETVYSLINNSPFILAGGSLQKETPNDFDIYPLKGCFDKEAIAKKITELNCGKVVFSSRNALSVVIEKNGKSQKLQFCNYCKNSVEELISSFDFSHCQIAVVFSGNGNKPTEVFYTNEYAEHKMTENTEFTGSEYPTSSLVRLVKYSNRGMFSSKQSYINALFKILTQIVDRGFEDYDDFKDQMDAIDLGLSGYGECFKFYQSCKAKHLTK